MSPAYMPSSVQQICANGHMEYLSYAIHTGTVLFDIFLQLQLTVLNGVTDDLHAVLHVTGNRQPEYVSLFVFVFQFI